MTGVGALRRWDSPSICEEGHTLADAVRILGSRWAKRVTAITAAVQKPERYSRDHFLLPVSKALLLRTLRFRAERWPHDPIYVCLHVAGDLAGNVYVGAF